MNTVDELRETTQTRQTKITFRNHRDEMQWPNISIFDSIALNEIGLGKTKVGGINNNNYIYFFFAVTLLLKKNKRCSSFKLID